MDTGVYDVFAVAHKVPINVMNYVWLWYSQPTCTMQCRQAEDDPRMMHMTFTFAEKSVNTFLKKKLHCHSK